MIGSVFSIRAILTQKSPVRATNSLVPSRGSISQKRFQIALSLKDKCTPSSLRIGKSVSRKIEVITVLALISAFVKGDLSNLYSTVNSGSQYTSKISEPAYIAARTAVDIRVVSISILFDIDYQSF